MPEGLFHTTLQRALRLAGSRRRLAYRLQVSESELEDWLSGRGSPPMAAFLAAVDVINDPTELPSLDQAERRRSRRSTTGEPSTASE